MSPLPVPNRWERLVELRGSILARSHLHGAEEGKAAPGISRKGLEKGSPGGRRGRRSAAISERWLRRRQGR